ncbi:nuclear transport factor 2 family protein [Arcticibacterium luteifluviistationis]|nr:nuclear transport factor 2 family protein [Arcticibacterium luteifluviistationis]
MKKITICLLMLLPFVGFSQKKVNGTIYIEHPALGVVDAFTKALVKGDTTAMAKLMTDDFRAYNPVTSSRFDKGESKSNFLQTARVWFEGLNYFSIESAEGAYPDAFEYTKDPSDNNAVTVDSWDILKGVHKKTGVKADMYVHRSFTLTKANKIRRLANYINPEFGNEIRRGYSERKNGIIYNQHENINSLRLMMAAAEYLDTDKYYSFFDENATYTDINNPSEEPITIDELKENNKKFLEAFEIVQIEQIGYPDYMEYEMGGTGVLYSWWDFHVIRKSDKKEITVPFHYQHNVNKEGKIVHTIVYYNNALFK